MRGAYGQLVLKPAKDLALMYHEPTDVSRALGSIEAKVDILLEADSRFDTRLQKVESKQSWYSGAIALMGFIITTGIGAIAYIPWPK